MEKAEIESSNGTIDGIYFRHSHMRNYQRELTHDIYDAIGKRQNIVVHAPTGTGKTDSAISAALTYALTNNLSVFFLTPKISQHRIAIEVARGISEKYKLGFRAIDIIGRRYSCIDETISELDHEGFYQTCEKKRGKKTCEFYGKAVGYSKLDEARANLLFKKVFHGGGEDDGRMSIENFTRFHSEVVELGETHLACPYEWMMKIASESSLVVADYYHLLIPKIRDAFLAKIKKKMENSIIIVDEAHNLSARVRDHLSSTLNSFILGKAEQEMAAMGIEHLGLAEQFEEWAEKVLGGLDDANNRGTTELAIGKADFDRFLADRKYDAGALTENLEIIGAEIVDRTGRKSACLRFAAFLRNWFAEEKGTVRILRKKEGYGGIKGGAYFSLTKKFMDPSVVTSALNNSYASILMSGTMLPMEMHRDVLGLDTNRTLMKKYKSPFDQNNKMQVIVKGVTTRYTERNPENYAEMAGKIDRIIRSTPRGVALFFPSYAVLNAVVPLIKSGPLIIQEEKMGPQDVSELLARFRKEGVLCAVQGGSLSEGIDYCNEEIKTAVIIGIALEEPSIETRSLIDYYQQKFAKGWEYGYIYPAVIKAMQAGGRAIRKETDRAAIVFMDERFGWKKYAGAFEDGNRFVVTDEPERYVKFFWSGSR